ncbi:MAG: hypothetical protein FJ100_18975 [Deltaproteobacteria bacterium]|nr:hypothetical protein [Deltaproteobacteria bacterium]
MTAHCIVRKPLVLSLLLAAWLAQACVATGGGSGGVGGGNGLPGGVTPTDAGADGIGATDTTGGSDGSAAVPDATTGGDTAGTGNDGGPPADGGKNDVAVVDAVATDAVQDGGSDSGKTDGGAGEIGPPQDAKDGEVSGPDGSDAGPPDVQTDAFGTQSCCATSPQPGCADKNAALCVCAKDNYCCKTAWDSQCVKEVNQYGCGFCPGGPDGGGSDGGSPDAFVDSGKTDAFDAGKTDASDGGAIDAFDGGMSDVFDGGTSDVFTPGSNSCCEVSAKPGCIDPAIMQCVCAVDDYCCSTAWDSICVSEVTSEGCGTCPGSGADGGSAPDAGF